MKSTTFTNNTVAVFGAPTASASSEEAVSRTWAQFVGDVASLLEPTAAAKGYNTTGVDGQNPLYEFVQDFAGFGHAGGEIVYKAKRYAAKRNPEDLCKIAAWAFLAWRHHK